ncbi:MAG: pyrroline-5-carboxylate reductase [Clostridia bacterium]|nr:pyrroline-5-carboxylate reductase [Clostridia bacterium]
MFGFIGVGNMGSAVAAAVCKRVGGHRMLVCNRSPEKAQALAGQLGCAVTDAKGAAASCRYLFLGVKPQGMEALLTELRPVLQEKKPVLVSMAAGLTAAQIEEMAGGGLPVMRIMPNTPVALGCGIIMYCKNALLTDGDERALVEALSPAGIVDPLEEHLMDAGSALCGCSPAFTDLYMEALADGAVACGIPRSKALKYAAAAVAGAARLALETGDHPGALKDAVCSPGGSTIQGVRALENRAFRGAVMEAVITAAGASGNLGKK